MNRPAPFRPAPFCPAPFCRGVGLVSRLLALALVGVLSLTGGWAIATPPSYAQIPLESQKAIGQTKGELTGREKGEPLSAEEKLDRAYSISEEAGLREEQRQAEGKDDPREGNESLAEKVKDVLDSITKD